MKSREKAFLLSSCRERTTSNKNFSHLSSSQSSENKAAGIWRLAIFRAWHEWSKYLMAKVKLNKVSVWHVPAAINHSKPTAQALGSGPCQWPLQGMFSSRRYRFFLSMNVLACTPNSLNVKQICRIYTLYVIRYSGWCSYLYTQLANIFFFILDENNEWVSVSV